MMWGFMRMVVFLRSYVVSIKIQFMKDFILHFYFFSKYDDGDVFAKLCC